jgi:signal transduction histidine kinase
VGTSLALRSILLGPPLNSLRARIALVLVVSIISVVGVATAATIFILAPRGPEEFIQPTVMQLKMLLPLFENREQCSNSSPVGTGLEAPISGAPRAMITAVLQKSLRDVGIPNRVVVTKPADSNLAIASIEVPDRGWLALPIADDAHPGGVGFALLSWISLIITGAIVIALAVGHRVARPLALLESVADTISQSGRVSVLCETGPAEVKATARALNRLTKNLNTAMESRMRLVAAAGHDLRTPITRMRLRAEFLPEREQRAWLHDLDELRCIADSSIQLVHEEVERKPEELVRFDQIAESVVAELAATGLMIDLVKCTPLLIRAAPLGVTRVLRNVITNAATHGKGCRVLVEARQQWAIVVVEDSGPGIPEPIIDRVFEPFFRSDPARRQIIPGAGLGLAIAKEITERHNGQIILTNRAVEGGLRQEIRFPRHPMEQGSHQQSRDISFSTSEPEDGYPPQHLA